MTQGPLANERMNKMRSIYTAEYTTFEKEQNSDACCNADGPLDHKVNKPVTDRPSPYDLTYRRDLKHSNVEKQSSMRFPEAGKQAGAW